MPEIVKTTIGDVEFQVELMPTTIAAEVAGKLQGLIAVIFGPNLEYKEGHSETWIMESIAGYLTYYNQHIDFFELTKKTLGNVDIVYVSGDKAGSGHLDFKPSTWEKRNPDPFCFDNFFSRKLDLLFELLIFALGENFPDVFGKVSSVIQMIRLMNGKAEETNLDGESN